MDKVGHSNERNIEPSAYDDNEFLVEKENMLDDLYVDMNYFNLTIGNDVD